MAKALTPEQRESRNAAARARRAAKKASDAVQASKGQKVELGPVKDGMTAEQRVARMPETDLPPAQPPLTGDDSKPLGSAAPVAAVVELPRRKREPVAPTADLGKCEAACPGYRDEAGLPMQCTRNAKHEVNGKHVCGQHRRTAEAGTQLWVATEPAQVAQAS